MSEPALLPHAKIKFNRDGNFDLQLSDALVNERRLAEIFSAAKIEKIELKSETWLWERTGNICIEYARTDVRLELTSWRLIIGFMSCAAMVIHFAI